MVIRDEQIRIFQKSALHAYEQETVAHVMRFEPRFRNSAPRESISRAVHLGFERAAKYGFTCCGPLRFYVEMMICFGSDFDTDPQFPWAADALASSRENGEMIVAERLYEGMQQYTEEVFGSDDGYLAESFRRFSAVQMEYLLGARGPLEERILEMFEFRHPWKRKFVGDPPLRALIGKATNEATRLGMFGERAEMLVAELMFTFGQGVLHDPFHHWVQQAADSETSESRVERVRTASSAYVAEFLSNFSRVGVTELDRGVQ